MHLPFCAERCGYCSFNTAPYTPGGLDRFLAALLRECDLAGAAPWAGRVTLDTLFLGGGTPSLLDPPQMAAVLDRIRTRFRLEPGAEVTVECNPDDVTVARLAGYRRAGVTRISLGVQSLDDAILPRLDRRHSAAQAAAAFRGRPRGRVRQHQRGSHLRPARARPGHVDPHGAGGASRGARTISPPTRSPSTRAASGTPRG